GAGNPAGSPDGDGGIATTASADGTIDVQVKRAPDATTAPGNGLGLGKLGAGAEVALAAQALGDSAEPARRPGTKPATGSAVPQGAGANNSALPASASGPSAQAVAQANVQAI